MNATYEACLNCIVRPCCSRSCLKFKRKEIRNLKLRNSYFPFISPPCRHNHILGSYVYDIRRDPEINIIDVTYCTRCGKTLRIREYVRQRKVN